MPFFLSFTRRPCKKSARVPHEIALFVLKITHLAIWMEPTSLPDHGENIQLQSPTPIMALVIYLRRIQLYLEDKVISSGILILRYNHL